MPAFSRRVSLGPFCLEKVYSVERDESTKPMICLSQRTRRHEENLSGRNALKQSRGEIVRSEKPTHRITFSRFIRGKLSIAWFYMFLF